MKNVTALPGCNFYVADRVRNTLVASLSRFGKMLELRFERE